MIYRLSALYDAAAQQNEQDVLKKILTLMAGSAHAWAVSRQQHYTNAP
ncbi:MAG: hypothetical protein H7228_14870 [Polaromonas sp.]|nr:hypothetical protein [Polaromonas sp.]